MSDGAVQDLITQTQHAFHILYKEIELFDEQQWKTGLDFFLTPVNIAMHIFDCLDYYFGDIPPEEYQWGHRFGGGWWELPLEKQPDQQVVLDYAHELERRIIAELGALSDVDLLNPWSFDPTAGTYLGHFVYAMKHTMHHHGELAALAVFHGKQGGSWE
jgi:uncharacterized damage-inducible protein DinB